MSAHVFPSRLTRITRMGAWTDRLGLLTTVPIVLLLAAAPACGRPSSSQRVISLTVAVDREFRTLPEFETVIRRRIESISELYASCGVKWTVAAVVPWESTSPDGDLELRRRRLTLDIPPTDADIRLGIVRRRTTEPPLGSAVPFTNTLVVVDFADQTEEFNTVVLAHELGHLFGAWHVDDPQSAMAERPSTLRFDERSRSVIARMRDVDFRKGIDALDQEADRIIEAYASTLEAAGSNPAARAQAIWAGALRAEGHSERAVGRFRKALDLEPEDAVLRYELAQALRDAGELPAAVAELRRVIALEPDHVEAREQLGIVLAKQGSIDAAIEEFVAAIRTTPDRATLHLNLGMVLAQQPGQLGAAIAQFEEALRINSAYATARQHLQAARSARALLEQSVNERQHAVQRRPRDANARYNLGVALLRQGAFDRAAEELRRAIRLAPKHGQAHYNLAVAPTVWSAMRSRGEH